MTRIAVIGAGRIGGVHAHAVAEHPDAELVGVCDPVESSARALAEAHGVRALFDASQVFADSDVDAVIIGSPTGRHVEHILAAVSAGKAVLCEKPIALDLDEARRCVATLGERAERVMMGFNRRFDPTFAEIRSRVAAGEIGELRHLSIVSRDPEAPPPGYIAGSGGLFKDMSIHDFDMAAFFLGEIAEVSAMGCVFDQAFADADDYDQAIVALRGTSGASAAIINSRICAYGYDQRLEAFGSSGSLSADNLTETAVRKASATQTEAKSRVMDFFLDRYAAAYALELDAFVRAEAGPVSPNLTDGLAALLIAEAAIRSAATGSAVRPVD